MCTESQLKNWMEHLALIVLLLTIAPFVSITSMFSSGRVGAREFGNNPSTVSVTPTDVVDDHGRTDCCTGGVGSIVHNRALTGRVPETLWMWLVALPQVELSTTLADVTRIPLNNAHNKSLAN